jgi:hypothetical protein
VKNTKVRITADTEKINSISNQLFGASPIQLDEATAMRVAEETTKEALESYRRKCVALVTKRGA